jgi:hypothetical protein
VPVATRESNKELIIARRGGDAPVGKASVADYCSGNLPSYCYCHKTRRQGFSQNSCYMSFA